MDRGVEARINQGMEQSPLATHPQLPPSMGARLQQCTDRRGERTDYCDNTSLSSIRRCFERCVPMGGGL